MINDYQRIIKNNVSIFANPFLKGLDNTIKSLQENNKFVLRLTIEGLTFNNENQKSFLQTSPGVFIEELVFQKLKESGYQISPYANPDNKKDKTFDYIITDPSTNQEYLIDCKSCLKNGNGKLNPNQQDFSFDDIIRDDQNRSYIIYIIYSISFSNNQITIASNSARFMPTILAGTKGQRVTYTNFDTITQNYINSRSSVSSIYEEVIFSHTGKQLPRSVNETISYLDSYVNEAKKYVQLKKFIEENFTKKGDYLYPINGNKKCSFHSEYDKGLLKFFAEHGITKIESVYSNNTPSLGFSETEQKWYGWSHRAIYGFGIGDKIKKGTCGYEKMKEKGLLNIKTLDQAKEVAKVFAEDVG